MKIKRIIALAIALALLVLVASNAFADSCFSEAAQGGFHPGSFVSTAATSLAMPGPAAKGSGVPAGAQGSGIAAPACAGTPV
jgi:hypothetical protein